MARTYSGCVPSEGDLDEEATDILVTEDDADEGMGR